ncbi:hypothetical protein AOLI_G00131160 [Acnodon oligacanthus]
MAQTKETCSRPTEPQAHQCLPSSSQPRLWWLTKVPCLVVGPRTFSPVAPLTTSPEVATTTVPRAVPVHVPWATPVPVLAFWPVASEPASCPDPMVASWAAPVLAPCPEPILHSQAVDPPKVVPRAASIEAPSYSSATFQITPVPVFRTAPPVPTPRAAPVFCFRMAPQPDSYCATQPIHIAGPAPVPSADSFH